MPAGGTLVIATERVDLAAPRGELAAGAYALVTVSDTGVGMDAATLSRIFEPFFTTKEVGRGTGLGLAIVYGIVKRHRGAIEPTSEPGRGTTFRIYLPLLAPSTAPSEPQPSLAGVGDADETILLAEDDAAVRRSTRLLLEQHGYTVLEAVDGADAVRVFQENRDRVQLVICDLVMPGLNGREAFEAIRKIRPAVPALFVSGYGEGILAGKGLGELGELLSKPVQPADLLVRIRVALDAAPRESITTRR
jgi:CheY-like chemotaxis protein